MVDPPRGGRGLPRRGDGGRRVRLPFPPRPVDVGMASMGGGSRRIGAEGRGADVPGRCPQWAGIGPGPGYDPTRLPLVLRSDRGDILVMTTAESRFSRWEHSSPGRQVAGRSDPGPRSLRRVPPRLRDVSMTRVESRGLRGIGWDTSSRHNPWRRRLWNDSWGRLLRRRVRGPGHGVPMGLPRRAARDGAAGVNPRRGAQYARRPEWNPTT